MFSALKNRHLKSNYNFHVICYQPEHQQLIVDTGALSHLVDLLKRHKEGSSSRAVNSVIRRAADAITNLAHENSSIKTRVRFASLCATALYSASSFLLLLLFFMTIWSGYMYIQDGRWDSASC